MKVKKLQTGYVIRLNDSEFAALEWLIGNGTGEVQVRDVPRDRTKFCGSAAQRLSNGLRSFVGGLKVTEDRRK